MLLTKTPLLLSLVIATYASAYPQAHDSGNSLKAETLHCAKELSCFLRSESLEQTVKIRGDWLIFWKQLLTPKQFEAALQKSGREIRTLSLSFVQDFSDVAKDGHGYITVQKELIFEKSQNIAMFFPTTSSARKVWLNDNLILEQGVVGRSFEEETLGTKSESIRTFAHAGVNKLTIQISNFHHFYGGHTRNIIIGTPSQIDLLMNKMTTNDALSIGAILIMTFYHLYLWIIRRTDMGSLFFSFFCASIGIRSIAMGGAQLLHQFINGSEGVLLRVKLEYFGFSFGALMIGMFMHSQFYKEYNKWVATIGGVPFGVWTLVIIFTSPNFFPKWLTFFQFWTVGFGIVGILALILAILRKRDGAGLSLLGFGIFFVCVTHDILRALGTIESSMEITQLGLFMFLFFQSTILAYRFNKSFIKLDHAEREIRSLNLSLEKKVEERTKQINTILSNVQSGFLIISENCIIQPGFTQSCHELLDVEITLGISCIKYFQTNPRDEELFRSAVIQTFHDIMPESVNLAQIPNRMKSRNNRILSILYSVIRDNETKKVDGILLTINDASSLVQAEEQVMKSQIIVKILQNKASFDGFVQDFEKNCTLALKLLIENSQPGVRSILHTLKGNVATFGFKRTVDLIHQIEDKVTISTKDISVIKDSLMSSIDEFKEILDFNQESKILIPRNEVMQYIALMKKSSDKKIASTIINNLSKHTLAKAKEILGPIEDMVSVMGERLEKEIQLDFRGKNCPINQEHTEVVRNVIHLIRNSIDHGIEESYHRHPKDSTGHIYLVFNRFDSEMKIEIADDGKGIDTHYLYQLAVERKIIDIKEMSESDKENLIFHPGLSTTIKNTDLSGRGIGMYSIKKAIDEVGGKITVENRPLQGCTFLITLPFKKDIQLAI